MNVNIILIMILEDNKYDQHEPEYIKILLDDDNQIPTLSLTSEYESIKACLEDLYNKLIKIDYEWTDKQLVDCRMNNNNLEVIYKVYLPYISGSIKSGNPINITDFPSTISDEYYVECITGNLRRF